MTFNITNLADLLRVLSGLNEEQLQQQPQLLLKTEHGAKHITELEIADEPFLENLHNENIGTLSECKRDDPNFDIKNYREIDPTGTILLYAACETQE